MTYLQKLNKRKPIKAREEGNLDGLRG